MCTDNAVLTTCETRRGLHAPVALDAVEGVLVAAAAAAQHRLGPSTHLDARMSAEQLVALLLQRLAQQRRDHLGFWLLAILLCLVLLLLVHHVEHQAEVLHVHDAAGALLLPLGLLLSISFK